MADMIGFNYGALNDSLEVQTNAQGYTLGDEAAILQRLADGLVINHIHGTLTDSACSRALSKLHNKVISACNPMSTSGEKKDGSN